METIDELTEKLVTNYGLSLESAQWVESWIQHFVEKEAAKNNVDKSVVRSVPYQLCPKCNGDGDLTDYSAVTLTGSYTRRGCDVCGGNKIIPMAQTN